jgi:hypothetical protein
MDWALAPAGLSLLCVLIQPLGAGKDQREPGLVDVGDGLQKREGGVLFAVLDCIHVGRVTVHVGSHFMVGPALCQTKFCDDGPECFRGRVTVAFQSSGDSAGHLWIIGS